MDKSALEILTSDLKKKLNRFNQRKDNKELKELVSKSILIILDDSKSLSKKLPQIKDSEKLKDDTFLIFFKRFIDTCVSCYSLISLNYYLSSLSSLRTISELLCLLSVSLDDPEKTEKLIEILREAKGPKKEEKQKEADDYAFKIMRDSKLYDQFKEFHHLASCMAVHPVRIVGVGRESDYSEFSEKDKLLVLLKFILSALNMYGDHVYKKGVPKEIYDLDKEIHEFLDKQPKVLTPP